MKVPVTAYETKTNRKKLTAAFSSASPIVAAIYEEQTKDVLLVSDAGKAILISSALIPQKTTRTSAGVILFSLKKGQKIVDAVGGEAVRGFEGYQKCKKIKIPATGSVLASAESGKKQISLG